MSSERSVSAARAAGKGGRVRKIRRVVQVAFLVLIALIAVNHSLEESGRSIPVLGSASLHSICPFGGVVSIYQFAATGSFVQKIHESAFVLMILGFVLALLVGPAFCGWVCPLGTVQELVSRAGRKLFGRRHNRVVPARVDRVLRYLRFVVLAWVVWVTARSGQLIFADYDPYFALFNFWSGEVALSGLVILATVLLSALVVERPFCKYACPYGAVLGLFNSVRIFGIKRNAATCISCMKCDRACPMNITVSGAGTVRNHQCISCLECTSEAACPVANTVELAAGRIALVTTTVATAPTTSEAVATTPASAKAATTKAEEAKAATTTPATAKAATTKAEEAPNA